ncbi:hypothetical protein ROS62_26525 [Streptomyces sp. DSM 41972]|uniref:Uncharacterized protein n=1 Tax=Streptomyces althioticus subsp. attaecolombicae TaxID=3075534 RepID=A0ABU3I5L7_9ACTN|nr:hypothetical protein [Streptomyces sp. DSM 41972]
MDVLEKIVVPIAVVLISVVLAFFTARAQARTQVRGQQRLDYLLSAYRTIADCAHRRLSAEQAHAFERAMQDVVLLGTNEHIELATSVQDSLARGGGAGVDELLIALRRDLRSELGLKASEVGGVPTIRLSAGDSEARGLDRS